MGRDPLEKDEFVRFRQDDALIVVDVQRDFCPGGALAVVGADEIVPAINRLIGEATAAGATVVASRDWHPKNHVSFLERRGPWPAHCVASSPGAQFHRDLRLPPETLVVSKGTDRDKDQYSAFDGTGLVELLRLRGIRRIVICGLALDVCVRASALQAAQAGFETHVLLEATRQVTKASGDAAVQEMKKGGVIID